MSTIKSSATRLVGRVATAIDHRVPWYRLPTFPGILMLIAMRARLRQENLHDTGPISDVVPEIPETVGDRHLTARTVTGHYNSLEEPMMGSVGCRFGRNVPIESTWPETDSHLMSPNPRVVSRKLLTREVFQPATTLNVLAAAWLQFEVHDWFSHPKPDWETCHHVNLSQGDDWHENPMRLPRSLPDPSWSDSTKTPTTWVTEDSHWWDGSQIYGSTHGMAEALRAHEDGKLILDADGLPPKELDASLDVTGTAGNFWVGLGLLHSLFMKEHNAICDMLRRNHAGWGDDQLYDKARLINAALMAKIHTVEWTPGIIAHPTTVRGMRTAWYGLVGEKARRKYGRIGSGELLSGIPGSKKKLFGVPYSLTEEFGAVYRMHPLLPDDYTFRSVTDDALLADHTFQELNLTHARERAGEYGMANSLYSFGIAHPGAITLHNYPRFLQRLERPDGTILDLGALDVLRIRERGVARYNDFRRNLHMRPVASFEELTPNPAWQAELREVYDNDLENVDLMIGLYAEQPPPGFGFSDTAFRVFALMAPRRLNSDRFLTDDYRPEVYTAEGLQWIDDSTMTSVLLRHHPTLEPALRNVGNAFAPWQRVRA
ncbi:MAG: peroxidase family protein [Micropruina sp.]